jgi:hypothetical protein
MRLKSIKAGLSPAPGCIPAGSRIFSLGRTIVIIDNAKSQKLRFSGSNDGSRAADSGTAPDDDPV